MRKRWSTARGGHNTNTVEMRDEVRRRSCAGRSARERVPRPGLRRSAAMHHAGAGVIAMTAPGSALIVCTTASIHARSQESAFAIACASGAHHANRELRRAERHRNGHARNDREVREHGVGRELQERPPRPAARRRSALRSTVRAPRARDRAMRLVLSSQRSSGPAHVKIAPTQEKESANEAVATLAGRANVTASAAIASAFHESVARPKARAVSAAVAIVAARTAGSCAPLHADEEPYDGDRERARSPSAASSATRATPTRAPPRHRDAARRLRGRAPFRSPETRCEVPAATRSARPKVLPRRPMRPVRRAGRATARAPTRARVQATPAGPASIERIARENLGAVEPAVETALAFEIAFARLVGIARFVERLEPSAHDAACFQRTVATAHAREDAQTVIERKRHDASNRRRRRPLRAALRGIARCVLR